MKSEVSFRDILYAFKNWVRYLFTKWLIIVIVGISGGVAGLLYAAFSEPEYEASLSFILANAYQTTPGVMSIATQLGLGVANSQNDVFSGDNIISLMKSRKMVQQALLKKPENGNLSLLNLYCKDNELDTAWQESEYLKKAYPFPDSLNEMSPLQDSLFDEIYNAIQTNNLDVSKPDENQSIFMVSTVSENEIFSYNLTKYIVDVTSAFFISTRTKVAKSNLDMLQHEADSLRHLLAGAIVNVASETDQTFNLNPAFQVRRAPTQQNQAQAQVVGAAYGEVVKNLELAKIALQKETPLYQILDEPFLPLKMDKPSKLLCIIIGGFLSGILIIMGLTFKRFYSYYKAI